MSERFTPTVFGRYYLTERLARGGMAEVFKGKAFGAGGFEKTVVIKQILPEFADDPRFIAMMTDEARLTVALNHNNIIPLLDFGRIDGRYFIAMEYIDGIDLRRLLVLARQRREPLPPELVGWIGQEICRGLAYAHRKTDRQGTALGIVHRDISPHNILTAFTGEVKIADFGIAKAAMNRSTTQIGELKGKAAYMAPEQAAGAPVDARADLFAVGLVLYELFTGLPLFDGDSALEVMGRIKATHINAEMLPAAVPLPFRAILARALAHEPDARYANAAEMELALRTVLREEYPVVAEQQLAEYLVRVARDVIEARERQLDPPLDDELRSHLASFSGGESLAAAGTPRPFIADRSTATQVLGTRKTLSVREAFFRSAKRFYFAICVVNVSLSILADFLKPLFALAPALLVASGIVALGVYLFLMRKYRQTNPLQRILQSRIGEAFVFSVVSTAIWALLTLFSIFTPPNGVMASTVQPVKDWQQALLNIQVGIAEIRSTTQEIAAGVRDLREAIGTLSQGTGLIPHPKTPQEFYHNARQHGLAGRTTEAITAYREFLEREPNFLDVHQTYLTLLTNSVGAAAAREQYRTLATHYPDHPAIALTTTRLLDGPERLAAIRAVRAKNNYLPADAEFIRYFLDIGMALMTNADWREAKAGADRIATAPDTTLPESYLDKEALQRVMDELRKFQSMYQLFGAARVDHPLKIRTNQIEGGATISIDVNDLTPQRVWYRLNRSGEFIDLGLTNIPDPRTNRPNPNSQLVVALAPGTYTVEAKYLDNDGIESPTHTVTFEVWPFRVDDNLDPLTLGQPTRRVHLQFRTYLGRAPTSFRYSVDEPSLRHTTTIHGDDLDGLTPGPHTLHVQGIESDGTTTKVYTTTLQVE